MFGVKRFYNYEYGSNRQTDGVSDTKCIQLQTQKKYTIIDKKLFS